MHITRVRRHLEQITHWIDGIEWQPVKQASRSEIMLRVECERAARIAEEGIRELDEVCRALKRVK